MNDLYNSVKDLPYIDTFPPDQIDIIAKILRLLSVISIFTTFVIAIRMFLKKQIPFRAFLPFVLNLLVLFILIFISTTFGFPEVLLALSILLYWLTLLWSMIAIYPYARWLVYIQSIQILWFIFNVLTYFLG